MSDTVSRVIASVAALLRPAVLGMITVDLLVWAGTTASLPPVPAKTLIASPV
jgi:hypothetical protein